MILIPIMGAVSCFIGRNKKEHKEIDIFIHHKEYCNDYNRRN